jgi:hypothetical protein
MSGVPDLPEVPVSPRPRRIAGPSWFDLRLVFGVLLVLGSVLLGARVVSSARNTYPRVVATRELAAGSVLTAADVTIAQVRLPNGVDRAYVSDLADALGKQLSRSVANGELVPRDAVTDAAAQTTVTVPLASGAAPDLRRGERIEVWLSTTDCPSVVLLADVPVQAVHADDCSFAAGNDAQDVVISLAPALADRVVQALAMDDAHLRAGVLTGPAHSPDGALPLPDIASCAGTRGSR